jgi:hypothetical protein
VVRSIVVLVQAAPDQPLTGVDYCQIKDRGLPWLVQGPVGGCSPGETLLQSVCLEEVDQLFCMSCESMMDPSIASCRIMAVKVSGHDNHHRLA